MSAQIDVLAVFDALIEGRSMTLGELAMTRAAVAELIAADKEYDEAYEDARLALPGRIEITQRRFKEASTRRAAALANIGATQ